MAEPHGFSWVDEPLLAAMARPESLDDLLWLRQAGIQVLISLTEDPPHRGWINDAGLMLVHVPVSDMQPPKPEQLDKCIAVISSAHERQMAVCIHCGAGKGRTGVVLACYFVTKGLSAKTPSPAFAACGQARLKPRNKRMLSRNSPKDLFSNVGSSNHEAIDRIGMPRLGPCCVGRPGTK